MAVTVTITAPQTTPITLPFTAIATFDTTGEATVLQAAWYQIDCGDAINIDFPTPGGVFVEVTFTLDGLAAGEHILTVNGRSDATAEFSDQNFSVSAPYMPPPPPPPPSRCS